MILHVRRWHQPSAVVNDEAGPTMADRDIEVEAAVAFELTQLVVDLRPRRLALGFAEAAEHLRSTKITPTWITNKK